MDVDVGGEVDRAITTLVQNGDAFTYLGDKPLALAPGAAAWRAARSRGSRCAACARARHPGRSLGSVLSSKRSIADHPQVHAFSGVDGLRCVAADGREIPLHVDGDHIGDVSEAVFGVRPGALPVVS